jgi:MFS family permease
MSQLRSVILSESLKCGKKMDSGGCHIDSLPDPFKRVKCGKAEPAREPNPHIDRIHTCRELAFISSSSHQNNMPTFRHSLRSFPRAFWVLMGATFVNKFGVFVIPFLVLFLTRKGFTEAQAGVAAGAYSVGGFGAALLGGWMADRFGRNTTMAFASLTGAACMLCFSQADTLGWLVTLSFITGFINEAGNPATMALVQDLIPLEHRVNAYAVNRVTVNLAWALGPAAAGFLAEHSFLWLFVGDAATSIFFGIIAWMFLPKGNPAPRHESGWGHALRNIFSNRAFLALAAAQIFIAFNFRQLNTTFPLHFDRSGHSLHLLGYVQALNGAMIVTLELGLLTLTRHWPVRACLALGSLVLGMCYLLFFIGNSVSVFVGVMVVFTLGEMVTFSRQSAYISSLAPEQMRGRYSGFLSFSWCIGSSTAAMACLQMFAWNAQVLWVLCSVFGVLSAACLLVGTGTKRAR